MMSDIMQPGRSILRPALIAAISLYAGIAAGQSVESQNAITSIAIDPVISDSVYAGGPGMLYASDDAGNSWLSSVVDPQTQIWSLATDASRSSPVTSSYPWTYAAAGDLGVIYTPDLGLTWVRGGLSGDDMRSVAARNDGMTAYAGAANTIYRTDNRGQTWTILSEDLGTGLVTAIVLPEQDVNTIYVAKQGQGIYRSADGGVSWQLGDAGLVDREIIDLDIHPDNPSILFATSATAVYQSVDAGTNWIEIAAPGTSRALAIDPSTPDRMFAATTTAGMHRSLDGGLSWSAISNGLGGVTNFYSVAIAPDASGRVYAGAGDYQMFASDDYGDTWQSLGRLRERPVTQPTQPPVAIGSASLRLVVVDLQNGESVAAGSDARFRLELLNEGDAPITNAGLYAGWVLTPFLFGTDTAMSRTLQPSQGSCDSNGNCELGTIGPGQRATVNFFGATRSGRLGTYRLTVAYWSDQTSRTSHSQTIGSKVTIGSSDGGGGSAGPASLLLLILAWLARPAIRKSRKRRLNHENCASAVLQ